jgi:hypothetical protein
VRVAMLLPWWLRSDDNRPSGEVEDDIREELAFHVAEITSELERHGLSTAEARRVAAERFGDIDTYVQKCHRVKTGDRIVIQRILLGSSIVLAVLVGLLTWRILVLASDQKDVVQLLDRTRQELQTLRVQQQAQSARPSTATTLVSDVSGSIRDHAGSPIVGAHVLAVYKTWPGGRYSQESCVARTDDEGTFVLPTGLAVSGTHALQIAFVAEGYAFESMYTMNPGVEKGHVEPMNIVVKEAIPLKARVIGSNGLAEEEAVVFPSARVTAEGRELNVYFQGSEPIHRLADANGYVSLPYFMTGDKATVAVQRSGGEWEQIQFDVREDGEPIRLELPSPNRRQHNPFEF